MTGQATGPRPHLSAPEWLTWAMPPTIFSFTTTVSFSWSSKAAAFWAAFTKLSEALFTALPAACTRSKRQLLRTQGSSAESPLTPTKKVISGVTVLSVNFTQSGIT